MAKGAWEIVPFNWTICHYVSKDFDLVIRINLLGSILIRIRTKTFLFLFALQISAMLPSYCGSVPQSLFPKDCIDTLHDKPPLKAPRGHLLQGASHLAGKAGRNAEGDCPFARGLNERYEL